MFNLSGAEIGLSYEWQSSRQLWKEATNPYHLKADVQCFSGCTAGKINYYYVQFNYY